MNAYVAKWCVTVKKIHVYPYLTVLGSKSRNVTISNLHAWPTLHPLIFTTQMWTWIRSFAPLSTSLFFSYIFFQFNFCRKTTSTTFRQVLRFHYNPGKQVLFPKFLYIFAMNSFGSVSALTWFFTFDMMKQYFTLSFIHFTV